MAPASVRLLHSERVNFSMGVPTVWMGFFAHLDKHPGDLPPLLKRVVIGGSAVPAAMIERLKNSTASPCCTCGA